MSNSNNAKEELLSQIRELWDSSKKDNNAIWDIVSNNIIGDYRLYVTSGPRSFVNAENVKTKETITLFDCGSHCDRAEFCDNFRSQIKYQTG